MRLLRGAAALAAALLLSGCSALSGGDAAQPAATHPAAASATTSSPTPSPTPPAVQWQDAEALIILPSATTSEHLPHGPSWVTEGGNLRCGIYDDHTVRSQNGDDVGVTVFYGCRIDRTASTFTYPDFDNPGKGMIGGCPSGFVADTGEIPAPLCNSGQVFSSDTDPTNVLRVGEGVRFAGVECVATGADAMSCTEPAAHHGFRASLSDYALF